MTITNFHNLTFGTTPAPSAHDWDDLNEWERVLWVATASKEDHTALRMRLGDNNHSFAGACKALDVLHPSVTKPHPHWAYRADFIQHVQATYGVDDPVAVLAAALASRDVKPDPVMTDDLQGGK